MSDPKHGGVLRVVLDTNLYFSAFKGGRGVPFELWQKAVRREYRLLISPAVIRELADVLRSGLRWPEADTNPDDDRIVECAVAGNAHLIVSGDRHFTTLKDFEGIGIVRPADFLRTLG
jgi:predicted nucleic acid-binding protein